MAPLTDWYDAHARVLPWRTDPSPWRVLVSEVMLQQTPVARALPVFEQWMARWPRPADLAADPAGEAIRLWGRLGYPRRALRLHAAAVACVDRFNGDVPSDVGELRSLPGVGEYTAAAVAAFAFGQRHAVLDTNVRRVHARWLTGTEFPPGASTTAGERQKALDLLPSDPPAAAKSSIAFMELGALVCSARRPRCDECPLAESCAWLAAGRPAWDGPPRRGQAWAGSDRQCRGRLMAVLRDSDGPVARAQLRAHWSDRQQCERAMASLLTDGLIVDAGGDAVQLP